MTGQPPVAAAYRDRVLGTLDVLDLAAVERAISMLEQAWLDDRLVLLAGNGGSATTAEHMDLDLSKGIARLAGPGSGFRTIALTHGSALSAWTNDVGADEMFRGQVRDLGREGDVLVVFSAFGNSPNIVAAIEEAGRLGLSTIGFTGKGGGKVAGLVDASVVVAADDYGVIEDVHLILNHIVTEHFGEWAKARRRGA